MDILKPYRKRIDEIDDQIIDLLARRLKIVEEVAAVKGERGIPAVLEGRIEEVRERCAARAGGQGLDPELARRLYTVLICWCCDYEEELMGEECRKISKTLGGKGQKRA